MAHLDRRARLQAVIERIPLLDEQAMAAARQRQDLLTKPPGSLGRLDWLVHANRPPPLLMKVRLLRTFANALADAIPATMRV
jgi:hypothetical protein